MTATSHDCDSSEREALSPVPQAADVALLFCPVWDARTPPRGISCIAGALEHGGVRVRTINLNARIFSEAPAERRVLWDMNENTRWRSPENIALLLAEFTPWVESAINEVRDCGARIAGFSVMACNVLFTWAVAAMIKERLPGIRVVFGGPQTFFIRCFEDVFIDTSISHHRPLPGPAVVDYIVRGEGEESALELARALLDGRVPDPPPPGVIDVRDGFREGKPRPLIDKLAALPHPIFELRGFGAPGLPPRINVEMSRGCALSCVFCTDTVRWKRFRLRGADAVFKEMRALHERLGVTGFDFIDLLINADMPELARLCSLLLDWNKPVDWAATGIVTRRMTPEFLSIMKAAGCSSLSFGVENFHPDVLGAMKKSQRAEDIFPVIRDAHDAGIKTVITVIVGFPGETEEVFRHNCRKLREIAPYVDEMGLLSDLHLLENTPMAASPGDFGMIPGSSAGEWRTVSGPELTPEIRRRRYRRMYDLIRELGLAVDFENYSSRDLGANLDAARHF